MKTDPDGLMRWMYPVAGYYKEWMSAYKAMMSWMPKPSGLAPPAQADTVYHADDATGCVRHEEADGTATNLNDATYLGTSTDTLVHFRVDHS